MTILRLLALPALALLTATACERAPSARDEPLVVATFYPLYEFSRQVAGDRATVVALVPAGVEPHQWEPSPQDLRQIQRARAFVYNGAGLEPWAEKVWRDGAAPGAVAVRTTEGLALMAPGEPGRGREARPGGPRPGDREGRQAPLDPHVWLDPLLAQSQVESIRAGLARADPANAAAYADNARAFTARLAALHDAFERGLETCARRDLVVSHAAFGYLARRYRLAMVPVMGVAPESEPTPAELAAIVRFARRHQVKYIFFETLVSGKLAETLAREAGAQTLVLNPIEGLTREEEAAGKDYVALMEDNLKNLRTALGCR